MTGKLILVRHQESEWNKLGLWTGKTDVHLSEHGVEMSIKMGSLLKDIKIDQVFTSEQVRTEETFHCIAGICKIDETPTIHSAALNERDYGEYTGKNKWEVQKEVGDEQFEKIRREWDCYVPGGETLKMVYERVVPFYKKAIVPLVLAGENILIVGHGNTFRALVKYIENISDDGIKLCEILFDEIYIYNIDNEGKKTNKEVKKLEENK